MQAGDSEDQEEYLSMQISWVELTAFISIIAALVGFAAAGPGDVRSIAQAMFYIFAAGFFVLLFKRFWHRKPKDLGS
jgi:uncharacterized membrane protein YtjA (UPF0391 family)